MSTALRSPEQVAEELGRDETGVQHVPALAIRRLVREGRITALRGPRNKVLFDDDAVDGLREFMRAARPLNPVNAAPAELDEDTASAFNFATGRGRARRSA